MVLRHLGFESFNMGVDNKPHPAAPACFFVVQRLRCARSQNEPGRPGPRAGRHPVDL